MQFGDVSNEFATTRIQVNASQQHAKSMAKFTLKPCIWERYVSESISRSQNHHLGDRSPRRTCHNAGHMLHVERFGGQRGGTSYRCHGRWPLAMWDSSPSIGMTGTRTITIWWDHHGLGTCATGPVLRVASTSRVATEIPKGMADSQEITCRVVPPNGASWLINHLTHLSIAISIITGTSPSYNLT